MQKINDETKPKLMFDIRRVALAVLIIFGMLYSANRAAESSNAILQKDMNGTFDISPVDLGWSYEWAKQHRVLNIKPYPSFDSESK